MGDLFFPIGIALIIIALAVSALGLRNESFPGSRAALAGGLALFIVLVAATTTFAVINAREEQETRENEQAGEAAAGQELGKEAQQAEEVGKPGGGAAGAALELEAPESGDLAFDPKTLEADAGEVTIKFTNPAAIEHDVHIEKDGEDVAASDLVSDGDTTEASTELEAGEYVYYCSVPGHREAGMEGTLSVK